MTNPIIVALDVASAQEAMSLVRRLGDSVAMYKVGLELHTAAGRPFVDELRAEGRGIFLDLKLLRPAPAGSNRVDQLRPARPRRSGHLQDRGRSGGTARPQSARRRDGRHCLFPLEAAAMRRMLGPDKLLVVSGIRSAGVEAGDQKRVATPRQAIQAGASYLVVGRQITRATGPRAEALRILAEIE